MGFLSSILSSFLNNGGGNIKENLGRAVIDAVESLGTPVSGGTPMLIDDIETLKRMKEELPQFPAWTVGGSNFILTNNGRWEEDMEYSLTFTGTAFMLQAYKTILLAQGFRRVDRDADDSILSKMIDGKCYAFIATDAVCDNEVTVRFERNIEYRPDES